MSERKVLTKYFPPDFDPREIERRRGPKPTGNRIQTVRLMAPFSMKCTSCGEFIYKGRKFNSRKETKPEEKYLNIQIFFFHIRCTRCSSEITFRTDPKNNEYAMVRGAVRNMEPWRNRAAEEESVEARLDRLEREEAEAAGEEQEEKNAMADLEARTMQAREEIEVADALDRIRVQNAARARASTQDVQDGVVYAAQELLDEQERQDAEQARLAFEKFRNVGAGDEIIEEVLEEEKSQEPRNNDRNSPENLMPPPPKPTKVLPKKKQKKNYSAMLGIKGKKT